MIEMYYRNSTDCVTINPSFIKNYRVTGTHEDGFAVTFVMSDNSSETHNLVFNLYCSVSEIQNYIVEAINTNKNITLYCRPKG